MKKEIDLRKISTIVLTILITSVMVYLVASMLQFGRDVSDERTERMEEILREAAIQCFALEGAFPPTLAYLQENYGIILDRTHFYYFYEVSFGSNNMPDIIVTPKN